MKLRLILFLFFLVTISSNAQMLISGVIDGPLTGGVPKAIEFYAYEDIPDLSIFGFGSANNGGGSDGEEFTFPSVSVTNGTFIYVASEAIGFNDFFGFTPDYTSSYAEINGDDAIELFKNGAVFDVFGDINTDGTGEPWEYMDGWAYRNAQTGPDDSLFVLSNWTFSGPNALDGDSTNNTAATPFPIGSYSFGVPTIPDAPLAISATNITHESFTANWNASNGASAYFIDVSLSSDFSSFVTGYENLNVGNVTYISITGLNSNTDYYYRVRANNSAGTSENSNTISLTTIDISTITTVQFNSSSESVLEDSNTYDLLISIINPDSNNTTYADVVLISGDSTDIDNYTTQTISFPAGSPDNQTLTLTITNDNVIEGNETLTFELQNISGGNSAIAGTLSQFDLTIVEPSTGDYYDNIDPNQPTFVDDLKNRIRDPYTHVLYSQFDETNIANFASIDNSDGTKSVFCVYSNYEYVYSGTFTWIPLSREHTFPHSWMPTNPADSPERDEYADQHHLFPTHQDNANAVRSNYPLGNVENVTYTFLESKFGTDENGYTVYEPRDEHKGDAARAILYMTVRYDDIDGYDWGFDWVNANSGVDPQDVDVLLAWHKQDPPDARELERNDYVESIQGNRNPFVDHPEYVNYIDFYKIEYIPHSLFFSEYVEGSSNNKALEIYNNTGINIDLADEDYKIVIYTNGATEPYYTVSLTGTITNENVYVIANSSADSIIIAVANQTSGSINFNGNDAVALAKGEEIIDVIGQIGFDPGEEWGTGDISTMDNTIRRKFSVTIGDSDGSDSFDPSIEWIGFPIDTFDGLGNHEEDENPVSVKPTIAVSNYQLFQNYPNPFNPSTVIRFSLQEASNVKLTVYNSLGQKVVQLLDEQMSAGYHNINFDGSTFASGLYLYRLVTPNYTKTMKMMLLR